MHARPRHSAAPSSNTNNIKLKVHRPAGELPRGEDRCACDRFARGLDTVLSTSGCSLLSSGQCTAHCSARCKCAGPATRTAERPVSPSVVPAGQTQGWRLPSLRRVGWVGSARVAGDAPLWPRVTLDATAACARGKGTQGAPAVEQ